MLYLRRTMSCFPQSQLKHSYVTKGLHTLKKFCKKDEKGTLLRYNNRATTLLIIEWKALTTYL